MEKCHWQQVTISLLHALISVLSIPVHHSLYKILCSGHVESTAPHHAYAESQSMHSTPLTPFFTLLLSTPLLSTPLHSTPLLFCCDSLDQIFDALEDLIGKKLRTVYGTVRRARTILNCTVLYYTLHLCNSVAQFAVGSTAFLSTN